MRGNDDEENFKATGLQTAGNLFITGFGFTPISSAGCVWEHIQ